MATPNDFDGRFHYCRVFYRSVGFGGSWTTDYPNADINLSIRLSELTRTSVSKTPGGDPKPLIVRLDGDELFQCPLVILSAPGAVSLTPPEAARLREYFLKGGIVWTDDSWGSEQWERWENEIRKVLPPAVYPIVDLPLTHPLFRMQFQVTEIPQIPNIGFWLRSGGRTSEQGADSTRTERQAIGGIYFLLESSAFGWTRNTGIPFTLVTDEIAVHVPVSGSGYPSAIVTSVLCSDAQSLLAVLAVPRQHRPTVKMLSIGRYPVMNPLSVPSCSSEKRSLASRNSLSCTPNGPHVGRIHFRYSAGTTSVVT